MEVNNLIALVLFFGVPVLLLLENSELDFFTSSECDLFMLRERASASSRIASSTSVGPAEIVDSDAEAPSTRNAILVLDELAPKPDNLLELDPESSLDDTRSRMFMSNGGNSCSTSLVAVADLDDPSLATVLVPEDRLNENNLSVLLFLRDCSSRSTTLMMDATPMRSLTSGWCWYNAAGVSALELDAGAELERLKPNESTGSLGDDGSDTWVLSRTIVTFFLLVDRSIPGVAGIAPARGVDVTTVGESTACALS
mmetsp:Transcript_21238/g.36506  ORF Transcript_21238/g.36506 Transcript_21238/m.36506 type:complete len:255 (+) Transcript_21238:230-994(+)